MNLSQLQAAQAAATTHYYSVNDGGTQGGNYTNNGATGTNSLAAGVGASTNTKSGIAIGASSVTETMANASQASIAIGTANAVTNSANAATLGNSNTVTSSSVVGLMGGRNTLAQANETSVVGVRNTLTGVTGSGVLGKDNVLTTVASSSVIGTDNTLTNVTSVAVTGGNNKAINGSSASSIIGAFNTLDQGSASSITGIGNTVQNTTEAGVIGVNNSVSGGSQNSIIGSGNALAGAQKTFVSGFGNTLGTGLDTVQVVASGATVAGGVARGIVMGSGGSLSGNDTIALGTTAVAGKNNAIAIGNGAQATGLNSISVGTGNVVSGDNSGAFGDPTTITGNGSYSLGNNNTISANNAFVIGSNVTNSVNNSVVLGANSTVAAAVGTAGATIAGTAYSFQGASPVSTVSVGASGAERTITNVAAGRLAANSTDAVNGSQLFATNQAVDAVATTAGKGWNVTTASSGTGTVSGTSVANVAPGATQKVTAGNNIAITQNGTDLTIATNPDLVSTSITTGNSKLDTTGVTIVGGPNGSVALTGSGLDNGGNKVVNVAPGTLSSTSTDAVNGSQLYALGSSAATVLGGNATYNTTTGQVTMSNVGGTGQNNVNDAIASVASTAGKGWDLTAQGVNGTNVAPGASVDLKNSDGNLKVAKTMASNDVSFDLADDVTLKGSLSVDDGSGNKSKLTTSGLAVADVAGNNATYGAGGFSLFGPGNVAGPSITMNSFSAGGLVVQNVAAGAVNVTSTDAVNGSQLYALGSSAATVLGGNATYNTTTGQVTMSNVGGTGSNNVNDAIASVASTAGKGWNVTTSSTGTGTVSGTTVANVAPGATQTVTAGDNISITQNGTDLTIATNPNLVATSITTGNSKLDTNGLAVDDGAGNKTTVATTGVTVTDGINSTTVGASGVVIAGGPSMTTTGIDAGSKKVTNVADGAVTAASKDAVNGSQLYAVQQIAGAGWNVTTAASGTGTVSGTAVANIAPGATQTVTAGNNIAITQNGKDLTIATNPDLVSNSITTGNSKLDTNGLVITGGPRILASGIDAGGLKVTSMAAGTLSATSTDGVNGSQLYSTNQRVTKVENTGVFYDLNPDGTKKNSITLQGGDANAPVVLSNVATGIADFDAVNVKQLKESSGNTLNQANAYTDNRTAYAISTANAYTDAKSAEALGAANSYTDQKFGQLSSAMGQVRREARQGAAIGLAAASLRYDDRPGKLSAAVGAGAWRGEHAFAMGVGYTTTDQQARFNLSATTSGRQWGIAGGMSFTLN